MSAVEDAIAGAVRGAIEGALDAATNFLENVYDWGRCELYPGVCETERQHGAYDAAAATLWDDVQQNVKTNPLVAVGLATALKGLHEMSPFSGWKHLRIHPEWSLKWTIRADAVISANMGRAKAEADAEIRAEREGRPSKWQQRGQLVPGQYAKGQAQTYPRQTELRPGTVLVAAAAVAAVFFAMR